MLNALRLAVTFAFAIASFYLVERPIRQGRFPGLRRPTSALGRAGGVVLVVLTLIISTAGATKLPPLFGDASHPYRLPAVGWEAGRSRGGPAPLGRRGRPPEGPRAPSRPGRGLGGVQPRARAHRRRQGRGARGVARTRSSRAGSSSGEVVTGAIPRCRPTRRTARGLLALRVERCAARDTASRRRAGVSARWERADLKVGDRTLEGRDARSGSARSSGSWTRLLQRFHRRRHPPGDRHAAVGGRRREFHRTTDAEAKAQDAAFDRLNRQLLQFAAPASEGRHARRPGGQGLPGRYAVPDEGRRHLTPRPLDGAPLLAPGVGVGDAVAAAVHRAGRSEVGGAEHVACAREQAASPRRTFTRVPRVLRASRRTSRRPRAR